MLRRELTQRMRETNLAFRELEVRIISHATAAAQAHALMLCLGSNTCSR